MLLTVLTFQNEVIVLASEVSVKYTKCAQQMAAYRLALEERTGYHCDVALIIVSTPETSQAIFIDGDQLALQESRFIKRAQQFHAIAGNNEDENSSQQRLQEQDQSSESS